MDPHAKAQRPVNNDIYAKLGDRWYEADDDPVALLRAEAALRNPWVAEQIAENLGPSPCSVLDIGCGGGFLANYLAGVGHRVTGLDADSSSLAVAADHDKTATVAYACADARSLPYADGSFQVVCAMDFLEHIDEPEQVIAEAARVLAPGGLFFFHTFNRNWLAWLVVIKGVEWFVKNTPVDMHVLRLFLKPDEVTAMCRSHGLTPITVVGSRPKLGAPFWTMLRTRVVPRDFAFTFTRGTRLGYSGYARKLA
jgi:2-polyprenyl-6-hydroxyphenyl methylase/3-demethylubiquinone-9 3-methyltransferase